MSLGAQSIGLEEWGLNPGIQRWETLKGKEGPGG